MRQAMLYHKPINLSSAVSFTAEHHRHSKPLKRHKFSIGGYMADTNGCIRGSSEKRWLAVPSKKDALRGVVTIDNCSSSWSSKNDTLEVRRLVTDGTDNMCSFLYAKAVQACRAMGYENIITYTQPYECGNSLLASGFAIDGTQQNGAKVYRWINRPAQQNWLYHYEREQTKILLNSNRFKKAI